MLMKKYGLVLVLGVALLGTSPASAAVINVTTGQTLFSDNFEGLGSAVSHAPFQDASGDYNPVASVGTWTIGEGSAENIQVTDSVGSPDPGAYEGNNYLRIHRQEVTTSDQGLTQATFQTQSVTGQHIRIQEMVNIAPSGDLYPFYMHLGGSSDRPCATIYANGVAANGSIDYYYAAGDQVLATGLSFTPDQWQMWQVDYVIGDANFSLSIDGGTAVSLPTRAAGDLALVMFARGCAGEGSVYIDDVVPEPGSLTVVVTGLLGILAYAWRKRK